MTAPGPFTVLTTMKNEGAFLIDWVAHHKALGFDRLVICTNDCADGTAAMARRLEEMGEAVHHATRVPPAGSVQRAALAQAWDRPEVAGAGWLWVCDADEYLDVHLGDGSVQALAAAASDAAEAVTVPWRIFGSAGRWRFEDAPVTALFHRAEAPRRDPPAWSKTLTRRDAPLAGPYVHMPRPAPDLGRGLRVELPGGLPRPDRPNPYETPPDWRGAQVNHYALRSAESFLVKRDRGRAHSVEKTIDLAYWDRFDCNAVEAAPPRRGPEAAACKARLLADPILAALHRAAVVWHRHMAAELAARPGWAALVAGLRARTAGAGQGAA